MPCFSNLDYPSRGNNLTVKSAQTTQRVRSQKLRSILAYSLSAARAASGLLSPLQCCTLKIGIKSTDEIKSMTRRGVAHKKRLP